MKVKLAAVLLAALLVCAPVCVARADEEFKDTYETEVSIGFTGAVYFVEMESGGMNIDFGAYMIPPRGVPANLVNSDGVHTLRVCDRRETPGKWIISAIITPMTSGTESFNGNLNFYQVTVTTGITANLSGQDSAAYVGMNTSSIRKFMEAAAGIAPGEYDLTAPEKNSKLYINPTEVAKIKPIAYSATVTWTLTLTP